MSSLEGAVIAIVGAGSGIGQGVASLLASKKAILSLADMSKESVGRLSKEINESGGRCIAHEVDVRDSTSVNRWIEDTVKVYGRLDGAVNSAGVFKKTPQRQDPVSSLPDEEWDFVLDINLSGMFRCLRAELAHIIDGGSIVNVSSVVGLKGDPMNVAYCVSKHGVIGLTRTAAKEVAARKIRVNCVAPGGVLTPMLTPPPGSEISRDQLLEVVASHSPMNRLATVEEIAKTIAFFLGPESSFTTGVVHCIDGGETC